jgi:hypothetical protein
MNAVLVPPAPRVNLVDGKGNITRPWSLYLDTVFARLGGTVAPSNTELEADIADLQGFADALNFGVFGRQVIPSQELPDLGYIAAFIPRQTAPALSPDDASAVICARVFASR